MEALLRSIQKFCERNAGTILTCIGSAGVVATSVLAVKATPKAIQKLEEAKNKKGEDLTVTEKIVAAGPTYIPSIVVGIGTVSCIVGANLLSKRNQAALVNAYTLADSSFKEYKRKLKELYGEEAHQDIVDAIAAEKAENVGIMAPGIACDSSLYVDDQCGETRIFYDEHSGRFFEATLEQVMAAEYHLNRNYTLRGYASLNEFYEFLGIDETDYGSVMGWTMSSGFSWVDFDHRKTMIKGIECYVISMPYAPEYDFDEY